MVIPTPACGLAIAAGLAMFQMIPVGRKPAGGSPKLVADPEALAMVVSRLAQQPQVAVDTEAASFHRYVDRVYLVQVSYDGETALVDPLAIDDLTPLGQILADPAIEVIFHDADYDLRILNRDFGFAARNVFDTRIAAQFAGEPQLGLGALLEKYFAVSVNKKLQRADWSRRPLTAEMIEYAADDTRYLLSLRDRLASELDRLNRLAWAKEEFRNLETLRWTQPVGDELAYTRIKGAKALPSRSLAVLRELYDWRERTAQALDRAPFRVLGNASLLAVARAAPRDLTRLNAVTGVPRSAIKRYGDHIVEAVSRGLAVPRKDLPAIKRSARPEHDHSYDRRLERLKVLRNKRAEENSLDPGTLCPNGTLQAIARAAPTTEKQLRAVTELREWQAAVLRPGDVLEAVRLND
jgi:ribonuclease D